MSSNAPEPPVRTEVVGSALVVTIDRPEAGNSLNLETAEALRAVMRSCVDRPGLRAVVLTGAGGRFFCTGGDLKAYSAITTPEELTRVFGAARDVLDEIEAQPLPVIAAINGYALGGGLELALACDIRVAASTAQLGVPQARLGIIPGWNGIERLVETVGRATAMRLLLSAERLAAPAARELRLVDIVTDQDVVEASLAWARQLDAASPLAIAASKRAVFAALRQPRKQAREVAAQLFQELWFSTDHREAERAFVAKRSPVFKGK